MSSTTHPGNEIETGLGRKREREYFHLGRGDRSPTHESSWKKNKAYFHLGRIPCQGVKQKGNGNTSPKQQRAASPYDERSVERRLINGIRDTLSTIGRPSWHRPGSPVCQTRYGSRRHLISRYRGNADIRQWMMENDNIKECRTAIQCHCSAGSTNDCFLPNQSIGDETLYRKWSLNTKSSIGAQHQALTDTLLDDRQKDVTHNKVVTADDDEDQRRKQRLQLVADDQHELPCDGHDDRHDYDRAALPPVRPETDRKERRYSDDHCDVSKQTHVMVQSTWLDMFQTGNSDAYEKRFICEQPAPATKDNRKQCLPASCTDSLVRSISENGSVETTTFMNSVPPLLLLPSAEETGSPEEMCSRSETASPPCMTTVTAGCSEPTVTIGTCDTCAEKTYENLQTGNNVITTGNNKVLSRSIVKPHAAITRPASAANRKTFVETEGGNEIFASVSSPSAMPHVANTRPASAVNRKTFTEAEGGNEIFASAPSSSAMRVKCSKNQGNNIRFEEVRRKEQRHNFPLSRILPKKRQEKPVTHQQYNSIIQQIPEIVTRCENSARRCREVLKDMNQLLRASRKENFWYQWTLQEMGIHISQSEHNAAVIPASVREQHSKTAAAYAHRSRVFTPTSGKAQSTELSTESARSRSSPPTCEPGLTGSYGRPERRCPGFIRPHAVRERTPIARTNTRITAPMWIPMRSSFQSSTNSSFQNYTHRLPAVRMARTKQRARRVRDDRQRGQEGDRRRDRSNTPPRRDR